MARLFTSGWEIVQARGITTDTASPELATQNGATNQTGTVRSGGRAGKCDSGVSSALQAWRQTITTVANTTYFARCYFNFSTIPTVSGTIIFGTNTAVLFQIVLGTDGTLKGHSANLSPVLNTGQWYRVEVQFHTDASNLGIYDGFRVDGVDVETSQNVASSTIITRFDVGLVGGSGTLDTNQVCYVDDWAVNNNSGASQNSWPGTGKVVLLVPISDNARGANWVAGAGGTSLSPAVANKPPVGVALASATNTSQIKNVTKDTTGNYDANLTTYTTAGIVVGDTINVVHPFWNLGGLATGTAMLLVSNPQANAGTESARATTSTTGTFPTGWAWLSPAAQIVYAPSPALGTSPVIRIGKRQSSTNDAEADFIGVYVDYAPAERSLPGPTIALQAVRRASCW